MDRGSEDIVRPGPNANCPMGHGILDLGKDIVRPGLKRDCPMGHILLDLVLMQTVPWDMLCYPWDSTLVALVLYI